MNSKKLIVVQQYLSWNGHYQKYLNNLISKNYSYIYCSKEKQPFPNSIFLSASYDTKSNLGFYNFIRGRFLDSLKSYKRLLKEKPELAHIIEFEPFSFLYLLIFYRNDIPSLIITIHSINRMKYNNLIKDTISSLQRQLYRYTVKRCAERGAIFVTHYDFHRDQLLQLIGNKFTNSVKVINYPCPDIKRENHTREKRNFTKLLIYGQIREDKGIFEFLSQKGVDKLTITIAGKVHDERIKHVNLPNFKIIDKFLSDDELLLMTDSHDFMLLPYLETYPGGAGTLKDSFAFGLPVIATDIAIFKEIVANNNLGITFRSISDITEFVNNISNYEYSVISSNCLNYARKYSWDYMQKEYFQLYNSQLNLNPDEINKNFASKNPA